ncbi:MAG: hypothetical protein JWR38_922 [Mucilaginibacter sp.]|nr:hypothetical protein [Mucilaginibacter sp.]
MNKLSKLIIGLVSLLSMSFLSSAPFEKNPQDCEMVSVIKKKKKNGYRADENNASLPG